MLQIKNFFIGYETCTDQVFLSFLLDLCRQLKSSIRKDFVQPPQLPCIVIQMARGSSCRMLCLDPDAGRGVLEFAWSISSLPRSEAIEFGFHRKASQFIKYFTVEREKLNLYFLIANSDNMSSFPSSTNDTTYKYKDTPIAQWWCTQVDGQSFQP